MGVILRLILGFGILGIIIGFFIWIFRIIQKKNIYWWKEENKSTYEEEKSKCESYEYDERKDYIRYRTLMPITDKNLPNDVSFVQTDRRTDIKKTKERTMIIKIIMLLCVICIAIIVMGSIFGIHFILERIIMLSWRITLYICVPVFLLLSLGNLTNKEAFKKYIKACLVCLAISAVAFVLYYNFLFII